MKEALFSPTEQKQHAGAKGHLLALTDYRPGTEYVYYWGFGWNRADVADIDAWSSYLNNFVRKLQQPLTVTIE